jgi:hypothetical protein
MPTLLALTNAVLSALAAFYSMHWWIRYRQYAFGWGWIKLAVGLVCVMYCGLYVWVIVCEVPPAISTRWLRPALTVFLSVVAMGAIQRDKP